MPKHRYFQNNYANMDGFFVDHLWNKENWLARNKNHLFTDIPNIEFKSSWLHTFNIKTLCWCYMWDIFRSKNFKQCCLKNFCFSCFEENINIYTLPALSRPNSNIRSSSCGVERSLRNISSKPCKGIVGLVI